MADWLFSGVTKILSIDWKLVKWPVSLHQWKIPIGYLFFIGHRLNGMESRSSTLDFRFHRRKNNIGLTGWEASSSKEQFETMLTESCSSYWRRRIWWESKRPDQWNKLKKGENLSVELFGVDRWAEKNRLNENDDEKTNSLVDSTRNSVSDEWSKSRWISHLLSNFSTEEKINSASDWKSFEKKRTEREIVFVSLCGSSISICFSKIVSRRCSFQHEEIRHHCRTDDSHCGHSDWSNSSSMGKQFVSFAFV